MGKIGTLEEDFAKIGIPLSTGMSTAPTAMTDGAGEDPHQDDGGLDESDDLIDGEYVTKELLDRIEALPFDAMEDTDFDDIENELGEKKIGDDGDDLHEQLERVIVLLGEEKGKRMRRFKNLSTGRAKPTFLCPQGKRKKDGKGPCVPSHVVVGSAGKLNQEARKKSRKRKLGKGRMSQKRSARAEGRRKNLRREGLQSPLAMELLQVVEGVNEQESISVRDEIIERCETILGFLAEEFQDESVIEIYEDALDTVFDTYEAGRLEEDVMNEDEFIAELEPLLSLITKSIERLEDEEGLGNV